MKYHEIVSEVLRAQRDWKMKRKTALETLVAVVVRFCEHIGYQGAVMAFRIDKPTELVNLHDAIKLIDDLSPDPVGDVSINALFNFGCQFETKISACMIDEACVVTIFGVSKVVDPNCEKKTLYPFFDKIGKEIPNHCPVIPRQAVAVR